MRLTVSIRTVLIALKQSCCCYFVEMKVVNEGKKKKETLFERKVVWFWKDINAIFILTFIYINGGMIGGTWT